MKFCAFKSTIIYVVIIFSAVKSFSQAPHQTAYEDFLQNVKSHSSLEFDVVYKMKRFSEDDTLEMKVSVQQVKQQDSLFRGHLFFDMDTAWVGYNGDNILIGDQRTSELLYIDPVKSPTAYIKSTELNDLIVGKFFQPSDFVKAIMQDSSIKVSFRDTLIDKIDCYSLLIRFPESDGFKNETYLINFSKQNGFYYRNIHTVEYQENTQYRESTFSNVKLGQETSIPEMSPLELSKYKHAKFDTVNTETAKLQNAGFIKGKLLLEDREVLLATDTAELILLDFWFSTCYACIKSIAVINQVQEKYGSRGVNIYGVNLVDTNPASVRIAKFIRNNPMSYPTIMLDQGLKNKIPEIVYPTLMILDRERNVVYLHEGYNDHLFEDVSNLIEKLLRK